MFQGHCILTSRISQKRRVLGTKLLKNTNRKPYTIYQIVPLSMTLSDLWPRFQGHDIFEVEYRKNKDKKDKVTIAQWETISNIWNGRYYVWWPWLTYKRVAQVCQHQLSFLLPARRIAQCGLCYGNVSVRLSVRLSDTPGIVSKRLNTS